MWRKPRPDSPSWLRTKSCGVNRCSWMLEKKLFSSETSRAWWEHMPEGRGRVAESGALSDFICFLHLLLQDELESYSYRSIYRCDAVNSEKHFPSLLLLVCQSATQKKPDIHFFNCETVKVRSRTRTSSPPVQGAIWVLQAMYLSKFCPLQAEKIRDDITQAVSESSKRRSKDISDHLR